MKLIMLFLRSNIIDIFIERNPYIVILHIFQTKSDINRYLCNTANYSYNSMFFYRI